MMARWEALLAWWRRKLWHYHRVRSWKNQISADRHIAAQKRLRRDDGK